MHVLATGAAGGLIGSPSAAQALEQRPRRPRAVALGVLVGLGHLGHGELRPVGHEQRVVAETRHAARRRGDGARPLAAHGRAAAPSGGDEGDHADEARRRGRARRAGRRAR